jgi:TRAP-type C4-dicarboxylate transport system substrate-binding protein
LALALSPALAAAAPLTLRLATAAPDGSSWAREFRAFSRDVTAHTDGEVQMKWYFGAIVGDELEVMERIARGQVDGTASAGPLCQKLSPTVRAMRAQDLMQSHEEARWLLGNLNGTIAKEILTHGLVYFGGPVLGVELVLSRDDLSTLPALERARLWRWDLDVAAVALSRAAGLTIVPRPVDDLLHAWERGEIDGAIAIPSTALAFQLLPHIRHVQSWPHGFLMGCFLIAQHAFDRMSFAQQQAVRADATKAILRVDEVARETDARLLGSLFAQQGISVAPPPAELTERLRAAMHEAPRKAADAISDETLRHLREILAEHRKHLGP